MLIGFILSAVLSPVSVISNDVCELLHDTLNNKNSENTLFPKKSSSTNSSEDNGMSGYIQTCKKELGGNGEILSKLNLLDTLNNLSFILPTMEVLLNSTY